MKALALWVLVAPLAASTPHVAVLELFTSQGCSSCPPAEALLKRLDLQQPVPGIEIIPLAMHVDYWDRLGWADPFASPRWTQRQYAYAAAWGSARVYTPQAVLNGREALVGHDRAGILTALQPLPRLTLQRSGDALQIQGLLPGVPLYVGLSEDGLTTAVTLGENKGRRLDGHGLLRTLHELRVESRVARWTLPKSSATHAIAFQQSGHGPIVNAGRLRLEPAGTGAPPPHSKRN